jgi:hypothetical protein
VILLSGTVIAILSVDKSAAFILPFHCRTACFDCEHAVVLSIILKRIPTCGEHLRSVVNSSNSSHKSSCQGGKHGVIMYGHCSPTKTYLPITLRTATTTCYCRISGLFLVCICVQTQSDVVDHSRLVVACSLLLHTAYTMLEHAPQLILLVVVRMHLNSTSMYVAHAVCAHCVSSLC